nr:glucose-methanol-choline oxidoreductase, FAD/NAD(P)-binding domain protein [Tanacetum cinerariifolium]
MVNSYVHVVKRGLQSESTPALVLDDECCNSKNLDHALFGRVKEFAYLANLKMVLKNKGFDNITIKYMGGFWVLLEFNFEDSKKLFQSNMGAASWFTELIQASMDFNINERVAWVEIEGVPFKTWFVNTFRRIASKWGTLIYVDGQEEDCFHKKRLCLIKKVGRNIVESFKIDFHGKVFWIRAKEVPGWVPDFMDDSDESDVEEVSETKFEEGLDAPNVEENKDKKKNASNRKLRIKEELAGLDEIIDKGEGSSEGLLEELGVELNTVAVNCNNQGMIHLSRNHVFHERTKHINVRFYFIREVLEAKTVKVLKVGTKHNAADALTKLVPGLKLQHCLELLNVGVG